MCHHSFLSGLLPWGQTLLRFKMRNSVLWINRRIRSRLLDLKNLKEKYKMCDFMNVTGRRYSTEQWKVF